MVVASPQLPHRRRRLEDGDRVTWLFLPNDGEPQAYVFNVFVNGTHPLFPWLGFFCAGIVLGRVLGRTSWRTSVGGLGLMLVGAATMANDTATTDFQSVVLSTEPSSRGVVYVASALGTALMAYVVIDIIAERFPRPVDPLRRAGQMTLTLYLLHIVVFNFAVDWMGWVMIPLGLPGS